MSLELVSADEGLENDGAEDDDDDDTGAVAAEEGRDISCITILDADHCYLQQCNRDIKVLEACGENTSVARLEKKVLPEHA